MLILLTAGPATTRAQAGDAVTLARTMLASLDGERVGWVQTGFDDPERFNFNYTPVSRRGLPLREVDEPVRELIWELVDSALGERGRLQARQIIELERLLYERSGGNEMRDPDMYLVSLFGVPATRGAWGWRFEGHHLSLNFTLLDNRVVGTTPAFFGGNPAYVGVESGRPELRPFALEEDRARALLRTLDDDQRGSAHFSTTAPSDVLTGNDALAARPVSLGVVWTDLNESQQAALLALLTLYAERLEPELAARELEAVRDAGLERLRFAWAGGTEPGEPHYYRIQGPTFVVEYDNTQSDANHVHTVWRNFDRDFGRDPLREHLAVAHAHGTGSHAHD